MKHAILILTLSLAACASNTKRTCTEGEAPPDCVPPKATNSTQAKPNALANFFYGIGDALKKKEERSPNAAEEEQPAPPPFIYDDPHSSKNHPKWSPDPIGN